MPRVHLKSEVKVHDRYVLYVVAMENVTHERDSEHFRVSMFHNLSLSYRFCEGSSIFRLK